MIADLCLVLLLDASGSISAEEWDQQARATAEALASPAIVAGIVAGPYRRIAVTAMEWSSATALILPWHIVGGQAEADTAAAALIAHQRRQSGSTAVGDALHAAAAALLAAPATCVRRVVDISGDGANNAGMPPELAVAELERQGATVNAIVIEDEIGVLDYYRALATGFVLPATWDSYAQAIKAKLALEIAGLPAPAERPAAAPGTRYVALERIGGTLAPWIEASRTTGQPGGSGDVPVEFALALLTGGLGFLAGRVTR